MNMVDTNNDSPRYLTIEEIKQLLERIEPPQISGEEMRKHTHKEIKKTIGYQLSNIKLRPSKLEDLGNFIENKSKRSFIDPGMPVGFNAAESVGQPATQLVLNTFHSAGQVGQNPFVRFHENIQLKKYKKKEEDFSMKVHMNNKDFSFEDLYIYSQRFVSKSLFNLLDTEDIIEDEYPFENDKDVYTEDFKRLNEYKDEGGGIRLKFNRELLFLHQIPLQTISLQLSRMKEAEITVFCGPQMTGIIDIYPKKSLCKDENEDFNECINVFKNGALLNFLKTSYIDKYPSIKEANVVKVPVTSLIVDVTPNYENEDIDSSKVRVWVDLVKARKDAIPVKKLEDLLDIAGYDIVDTDPYGMYYIINSSDLNIKEELNRMLSDEDKRLKELFLEKEFLETTPLYRSGYYCYISTKGTDLEKIRIEPDVDEQNTISNNVIEIYDVLGIEVARNYLEKEIFDLFTENDQNIAPRNISIIADWMTTGIRPISINPKSIPKSESSNIRSMCFERPKDHIVRGAVLGTEEHISNVSARVMFGLKQTLGTGSHEIIVNNRVTRDYIENNEKSLTRLTKETLSEKDKDNLDKFGSALPGVSSELFKSSSGSDILGSNISKGSEFNF